MGASGSQEQEQPKATATTTPPTAADAPAPAAKAAAAAPASPAKAPPSPEKKPETPAHHALIEFTTGLTQTASPGYMKKLYGKFPEYVAHPVTKGRKKKADKGDKGKGKGKNKEGKTNNGPGSGPTAGGNGYRLNVKNLAKETTEAELKAMFEKFGTISLAQIKKDEKGESRGFGFVVLANEAEGKKAIAELHEKEVNNEKGKKLAVLAAERRDGGDDGKGKGKGKNNVQMQQQQQMYMQQMAYMQQYAYMSQYYAMAQQQQMQSTLSNEYEGSIKSISAKHGFIVCAQTHQQFERDVYVELSLIPEGATRGTRVKFTVEMNEKGHPKAKMCKLAA